MIRARIPGGLFSDGSATVTTADTPPASPADGALWWNSTLGKLFVWYDDGDSSQWVPATPAPSIGAGATVDFDALMSGSDSADPMPQMQAIFSSGALEKKHVVFGATGRRYIFQTRPTTGLGPQGQYLTLPQRCTLEWRTPFDFSAYGDTSAPTYMRREGNYGGARAVVGSVAKGSFTVTVASGQAAGLVFGQRMLLRTTTAQDTLVGAWTLADAFGTGFAARAEDRIVGSVAGDTITFLDGAQDNYDSSATPVLQTYENEPEIRLINPLAIGPGAGSLGTNSDRFFHVAAGRGFESEGGLIENFGFAMRILSVMGGEVDDLDIRSFTGSASAAGGFYIGDATSNFTIRNCRAYNAFQPYAISASSQFYGITRDVTFRDCTANGAGFSMHNTHERISYIDCISNDESRAGFDIRSPNCRILRGAVRRCAGWAVIMDISPNGLVIDGLQVDGAKSGIYLDDGGGTPYDYVPDDFTVQNCTLRNIGAVGSDGGITFRYSQLHGGSRPVLGKLRVLGNYVSMNDNTQPYRIAGKWRSPQVVNCEADAASGATPLGASLVIDGGAGGGAGDGPSDIVIMGFRQSASFALPAVTLTTGLPYQLAAVQAGVTTTTQQTIAASKTLTAAEVEQGYNNLGATALVVFTLPAATVGRKLGPFYVGDADGVRLQATSSDTFRIGSAAAGAANGTITSTTVGAWVAVEAINSTSWVARVDAAANWTVA